MCARVCARARVCVCLRTGSVVSVCVGSVPGGDIVGDEMSSGATHGLLCEMPQQPRHTVLPAASVVLCCSRWRRRPATHGCYVCSLRAAHTCYVQTLLYADAVTRAGSFNPCAVVEALEDFDFDGMGNGPTTYRGSDHQCFKDVLVMKGTDNPTNQFDTLEIVEVTPRAQVEYPEDHPMFAGGDLGTCNPGA